MTDTLNSWVAISTICTAAITAIYAGLTYCLVRSNNQLVQAATEQQIATTRPIVQVRIQSRPGSPIFQMVISNVGATSAENLRLQINPDLITFHGKTHKERSLAQSSLFQTEIKSFPPRTELVIDLGLSFDFFSDNPDVVRKAPPQFSIRDIRGCRKRLRRNH